jgi:hypothetical protein
VTPALAHLITDQHLGSLYEEDPWLAHAVAGFVPRLASMTQNLITGMLVHSQAEATAKTGRQDP